MQFIMIRHAESEWNVKRIIQGMSYDLASQNYLDITPRIFAGAPGVAAPGGESAIEVIQRIIACLLSLSPKKA